MESAAVVADCGGGLLCCRLVDVDDRQPGALCDECRRDGGADAGGTAGHQRDLVTQAEVEVNNGFRHLRWCPFRLRGWCQSSTPAAISVSVTMAETVPDRSTALVAVIFAEPVAMAMTVGMARSALSLMPIRR